MKNICHLHLYLLISATCFFGTLHSLACRKQVEAVEGAPMELRCQSKNPIDSCAFDFPGFKKIKVYAGVKNQNYEFVGNYAKGECGIRFSAMKRELEGQVTVEVTFPDEDAPAKAEINVTMLYPPADFHLESNQNHLEFNEGDEMIFSCSCSKSNPLPTISLRIGDDRPFIVSYQTSLNASKTAEILDFDKKVVCVVHHPLLGDQGYTVSRPLTILYKPIAISESIHKVGRNISIKVTVSAYPKPHTISWMRSNGNYLTLENSWLIPVKDTDCIWEVGANMSYVTEDDLNHGSELTIANSEGLYTMKVILEAKKDPIMSTTTVILNSLLFLLQASLLMLYVKKNSDISGGSTRGTGGTFPQPQRVRGPNTNKRKRWRRRRRSHPYKKKTNPKQARTGDEILTGLT